MVAVSTWLRGLFDRSFDPETARRLPELNATGRSNVRGLYMVGEIAGTPLIKLGLNAGVDLIDRLAPELQEAKKDASIDPADAEALDVLIVGAGSSGLGAADRCDQLGLRYVVIEQQRAAQLIRNFTKGKPLFAEPEGVAMKSRLWFEECPKEALLSKWDAQIAELELNVRDPSTGIDALPAPAGSVVDVGLAAFPTIASYGANLEYLTRLCLADGRRVILATQAHWYTRPDLSGAERVPEGMRRHFLRDGNGVPFSRRSVQAAMRAIRETTIAVGTQLGVSVVHVERAVGSHAQYFLDDWHLTAEGNTTVAEAFVRIVSPLLHELKGPSSHAVGDKRCISWRPLCPINSGRRARTGPAQAFCCARAEAVFG